MSFDLRFVDKAFDMPTEPKLHRFELQPGDIVTDILGDFRLVVRDFEDTHGDDIATIWLRSHTASVFYCDNDSDGKEFVKVNGFVELTVR